MTPDILKHWSEDAEDLLKLHNQTSHHFPEDATNIVCAERILLLIQALRVADEGLKLIDIGTCRGTEGFCENVGKYMSPCYVCISKEAQKQIEEILNA